MTIAFRQGAVCLACSAALVLAWSAGRGSVQPTPDVGKRGSRPASPELKRITNPVPARGAPRAAPLARDPLIVTQADPFSISAPPAPPPISASTAPEAPAPAPAPPPFPYRYFGTIVDLSGVERTYLAGENAVFPIKAADTIDGTYRVDAIDDKQMTLTYLPLNISASIPKVSAAN